MTPSAAPPAAPGPTPRPRRRRAVLVAILILGAAVLDLSRAPDRQLSARFLLAGIHLYQGSLRDEARALGARCRFRPTCSRYAEAVIRRDGALVGTARAGWRILRCGPWTKLGTEDPP